MQVAGLGAECRGFVKLNEPKRTSLFSPAPVENEHFFDYEYGHQVYCDFITTEITFLYTLIAPLPLQKMMHTHHHSHLLGLLLDLGLKYGSISQLKKYIFCLFLIFIFY